MMIQQHWKPILFTLIALATIPAALIYTDYAISSQPEPKSSVEKETIPKVTTTALTSGTYSSIIQAYGEVKAVDEVILSSEISGRIIWRNPKFSDGSQVNQGETLLKLDTTDYLAALGNAKQLLAESELALEQEKRQQHQAMKDWQRSGIKEKASPLALRKPQLKVAHARYKAAIAGFNKAKRDLKQTQITAPFNGVIIARSAAVGSFIEVGSALATLRGSDLAEITLGLSDQQWQQLPTQPEGSQVDIHSRRNTDFTWTGTIDRLSSNIDPTTRLRHVIIKVQQPLAQPEPLLSGSFVSVKIKGKSISNLFALPASALSAGGDIWLVENNLLKRHTTKPLFNHNGKIFVQRDALPDPLQLVRKSMPSYLPEMKVNAQPEEASQ